MERGGEGRGFRRRKGRGRRWDRKPPPPPPFACRKVAGGSRGRPRTGTRPRVRGGLPPGSRPVSGRPPPGRPRVKGWSPSGATWDHPVLQKHPPRPTPVVKRNKNHVSQKVAFRKNSIWSSYTSKCSISGNSGPRQNGVSHSTDLPGKRFNKNAKIRIPRGSADLEFLLGKSPIRAPGRRTRNGPFRISITHSNVFSVFPSAQKSMKSWKSLRCRKKSDGVIFSGGHRRP